MVRRDAAKLLAASTSTGPWVGGRASVSERGLQDAMRRARPASGAGNGPGATGMHGARDAMQHPTDARRHPLTCHNIGVTCLGRGGCRQQRRWRFDAHRTAGQQPSATRREKQPPGRRRSGAWLQGSDSCALRVRARAGHALLRRRWFVTAPPAQADKHGSRSRAARQARHALAKMGGGVGWLTAGARTGSTTWLTSKKSKVPVARCARRDIVSTRGTS